ncbi:hypothetical protein [Rhizobium leguminosarum]|uniref:hypothetical protein n=1 Tax=Rhizobium leguminosarum TaxID=384 RepID=UPI002FF09A19
MMSIAAMVSAPLAFVRPGGAQWGIEMAQARTVDCGEAAEEILEKNDARLLSIRPHDDRCIIIVLVTKDGERPQKIIFQVPPAALTEK